MAYSYKSLCKFQLHLNITSRHKHVNHFLISTLSFLSIGVFLSVKWEAQNAGRHGGKISVFVVSYVLLH